MNLSLANHIKKKKIINDNDCGKCLLRNLKIINVKKD